MLPRRGLLQLLVTASVVVLSGCETAAPEGPTATPVPTPTPAELLGQASRRLAETPAVHFVLSVDGDTFIDTGQKIRLIGAEGDLKRPDSVRTTFQAEVIGRTVSLQLITIGEKSWTTNILTGKWEEAPLEFAYQPDILFSTQDGIGPVMGRVQNVTRLPDEKIDGTLAYHLQSTVDEAVVGPLTYYTLHGSPVTVDLWLDQKTSDLLQARMSEPAGSDRPKPAVWTLQLSHHGEDIDIDPPV